MKKMFFRAVLTLMVAVMSVRSIVLLAPSNSQTLQQTVEGGLTWSTPAILVDQSITGSPVVGPSISQDSSGKIWVFFTTEGPGSVRQILFMTSIDHGLTWSSPQPFPPTQYPPNPYYVAYVSLLEDSKGKLWAAWKWWEDGRRQVYYSTSDDLGNTWSDTKLLVGTFDSGIGCFLQVDSEVWLVFMQNWDVLYIKTSDGGVTWSSPQTIVGPYRQDWCSALRDSTGKIWVVYNNLTEPYNPMTSDIWCVTTNDKGMTWSSPRQITSFSSEEMQPEMVEFQGLLCVFHFDRYNPDVRYVVSHDGGITWSVTPERIPDPTADQHYQDVSVVDGSLWVVWQSKRAGGDWAVWFSKTVPAVYVYDVTWGGGTILNPPSPYYIAISCNHSITSFSLNKTAKQLSFIITANDSGICSISVPRNRFDSPFDMTGDGNPALFSMRQNASYSTLSFAYTSGIHSIRITGTERGYIIGDVNGDGEVNIKDIAIVAKNFGHNEEDYNP